MPLHIEKPGIRALGVAESFRLGARASVLAGVVMRSDLVVDGFALGRSTVGGDDATGAILRLFRSLGRNDINLVMVSGAILSLYNVVDAAKLSGRVGLPVICVTYKDSKGIEESIRRHFPGAYEEKLRAYRQLGIRSKLRLSSGKTVYARGEGIGGGPMRSVLEKFTIQGTVPEPLRVARILARAVLRLSSPRAKAVASGRRPA